MRGAKEWQSTAKLPQMPVPSQRRRLFFGVALIVWAAGLQVCALLLVWIPQDLTFFL
jgi:hypothetical protein